MRALHRSIVLAAFALACLALACDKSPTRPTTLPNAPLGPYTVGVEIGAPSAIAPGTSAQLSVTQRLSDGSSRDVTAQSVWKSTNAAVLSVSTSGVASAHSTGDTTISAAVTGVGTGTRELIVVPAGTYRLTGLVNEADNTTAPVVNARIEARTGSGSTLSTATGVDGRYRLYGVSGQTEVRLTKDGYSTHVETLAVVDHQQHNFVLGLAVARPTVGGTYTLTITASGACRDQLPEAGRRRTYTAVLNQQGPLVTATLSGATFVTVRNGKGNNFGGRVEPQGVTFSLTPYDWYYKGYGMPYGDLVELADSFYLVIDGSAPLRVSGRQLSGNLDGSFQVFHEDPRWGPRPTAECQATDHQFVLSRTS